MREIKFRAWNKELKHMTGLDVESVGDYDSRYFKDGYVLMQYTGLKDKNGKEIYEGDIVVLDKKLLENNGRLITGTEVVFSDGKFALKNFWDISRQLIKDYNYEIIGNIYENPNLIKE